MKRNKDKVIIFRVAGEELALIKERARSLGFSSVSSYLRKVSIDTAVINYDMSQLAAVKYEINKIGININQLVMLCHQYGVAGNPYIKNIEAHMGILISTLRNKYNSIFRISGNNNY